MQQFLFKFLFIIGNRKKKLLYLLLFFLLASIIDAVGISLMYPFIQVATNPTLLEKNPFNLFLINQLKLSSNMDLIPIIGGGIIVLFIIQFVLYLTIQKYIFNFNYEQKRVLVLELMNAYLYAPYTFHLKKNTSSIINNIISETTVFNTFLNSLLRTITNLIIVVVLLLLLAKTNLNFLLLVTLVIAPSLVYAYRSMSKTKSYGRRISQTNQEIIRLINHSLGSVKDTRIIGAESFFLSNIDKQARESEKLSALFDISIAIPPVVIKGSLTIFIVFFISLAAFNSQASMTNIASTMAVFGVAAIRLIPAINVFVSAFTQVRNFSYILDLVYTDLKDIRQQQLDQSFSSFNKSTAFKPDELEVTATKKMAMFFKQKFSLSNITYQYPEVNTYAIQNISLTIHKGESIGLIGKSGSGKTTLVDIILGLLYPKAGDIQVDGVSIYQDIRAWQNLVGYIPQSIFLTDETIAQNIAFGIPESLIDHEKLWQAIRSAQLEEFVQQLPQGVKTLVGERGVRLSGGQRQRIGIARALYHEPEILVLDEATSALDNATEQLVNESIKALSGTKTMIIIAHRLSTVKHCDRLYLLDQGKVIKSGTYEEVVLQSNLNQNWEENGENPLS